MLQVAPSSYYEVQNRQPSARARRDEVMGPVVRQLWEDNYRVYGAAPGTTSAGTRPVKRDVTATGPNQLWVTDLNADVRRHRPRVLHHDAFSRLIVGWRVASHMRTEMGARRPRDGPVATRQPTRGGFAVTAMPGQVHESAAWRAARRDRRRSLDRHRRQARVASTARRVTLHLPTAWPWETAWYQLFAHGADHPSRRPADHPAERSAQPKFSGTT